MRLNPSTGEREVLLEEKSNVWINLHDMLYRFTTGWSPKIMKGGIGEGIEEHQGVSSGDFYFIWASERSGYRQLYLYRYAVGGSGTDRDSSSSSRCSCLLEGRPLGGGGSWIVDR